MIWRRSKPWFKTLLALADQLASSLSSLVVTAIIANRLPITAFGRFAIGYACILFVVGLGRALWSEAAVVLGRDNRSGDLAHISFRGQIRWVQLTLLTAPVVLPAVLLGDPPMLLEALLWSLQATCLLGLVDSTRMRLTASGKPTLALGVSSCLIIANVVVLVVGRPDSVEAAFMLLTLSASLVVLPLTVQLLVSHRRDARTLLIRLAPLDAQGTARHGRRYAIEYVTGAGGYLAATIAASAVGGITIAAALRGAEVVLGPFRVIATALPIALVSALPGNVIGKRLCKYVGISLAATAGTYVILLLGPFSDLLALLLGESATIVLHVLPWLGLGLVMICISTGAIVGLRAGLHSARSLRVRATAAPILLLACVAGAALAGPMGAAVGMSVASTVATVMWWRTYAASLR